MTPSGDSPTCSRKRRQTTPTTTAWHRKCWRVEQHRLNTVCILFTQLQLFILKLNHIVLGKTICNCVCVLKGDTLLHIFANTIVNKLLLQYFGIQCFHPYDICRCVCRIGLCNTHIVMFIYILLSHLTRYSYFQIQICKFQCNIC